ncbi:DNA repair protein rad52 [Malassezia cuniculi]|uniref:DNA repair protein rad52 n=1 Tax=Malassezia cuniculi TaxID=948313 RepID=A0AAF0J7G7_9BASI|nr:DNA repair protein rad52 [Malassezia cuniculi]
MNCGAAKYMDAFVPFGTDAYPAGIGGSAFESKVDPETGLPMWSATRLATLQAKLNQRLGPEYLSQRPGPGGGVKLTYIEGWRVVDLANEVFGFNGWSTSIQRLDIDYLDVSDAGRCNCGVSAIVRITLRDGTFHEDIGYGHCEGVRGKHAALEKCKKEAVTDSIKRGLKTFGRLLGNCLYDRQYANAVLRMPSSRPQFNVDELHRDQEVPAKREAPSTDDIESQKAARLRLAEAAKAAHRKRHELSNGTTSGASGAGGGTLSSANPRAAAAPARGGQSAPPRTASCTEISANHAATCKTEAADQPANPASAAAAPKEASKATTTATTAATTTVTDDSDWFDEFSRAEADSMAIELDLEDELILRQSQIEQELAEDSL